MTARPLAAFETEPAENTYPRLPVRTGEHVFVWFAVVETDDVPGAAELAPPELAAHLAGTPRVLRLEPTERSLVGRTAPRPGSPLTTSS